MKRLLATALLAAAGTAGAAPYQIMDPRTLGLGGASAAAATSAAAAFYNPALLATARPEEDFALELPTAALELSDPDRLRDDVRDFERNDYISRYAQAIADLNAAIDAGDLDAAKAARDRMTASGNALLEALRNLSGKPLLGTANGGAVLGIPSRRFGASLYLNVWGGGAVVGLMSQADYDAAKQSLDALDQFDPNDIKTWSALADPTPDFTSRVSARFLTVAEVGLALARRTELWGGLALGVTPKAQQVTTIDYDYIARELDRAQIRARDGERNYSDFNVDLGVAKQLDDAWRVGVSVKNALPKSYDTARGNTIEVKPQVRAGLARATRWTTLAADLDLTENDPLARFGPPSRQLSLGAELNVWRTLLVRVGYRTDLAADTVDFVTAGLGLSLFGLHVEAAVGAGLDGNAAGGGAQVGFRF